MHPLTIRLWALCSVLLLVLAAAAGAEDDNSYYVPAVGSVERKQLLDEIRAPIEDLLGKKVKLYVRSLAARDDYALALVVPQDERGDTFAKDEQGRDFDGWVFSLLRKHGSQWRRIEIDWSGEDRLEEWQAKHPNVARILFLVVGVATNAEG